METTEDTIINSTDMSLSKLREMMKNREARCTEIHGVAKSQHNLVTKQQQQIRVCRYIYIYTKSFINGILSM